MMPVPKPRDLLCDEGPRATDTENLLEEPQQQQQPSRSFVSRKFVIATAVSALVMTAVAVSAGRALMPQQASTGDLIGFADAPPKPVALFSEEEGKEFVKKWEAALAKGLAISPMTEIMDLTADEVSWYFSGNLPPANKTSKEAFFGKDGIFPKTWGGMVSAYIPTNIFTVVDTEKGELYFSFTLTILVDGHGKVKPSSTSLVTHVCINKLVLNKDMKVEHFEGYWNPLNPDLGAAVGQLMPKPDKPPPVPEVIISFEDGMKFMKKFMDGIGECFDKGDWSPEGPIGDMFADELEWVFSGDMEGKGSGADYLETLKNSWGALVSKTDYTVRGATVDTVAGTIYFTHEVFLLIDGHGAVKTKDSMFFGRNFYAITLDKDHKITKWEAHWNSVDPDLEAKAGAVMAAAKKK
jgi:hypothetical protein